jgi:hypothetical protein
MDHESNLIYQIDWQNYQKEAAACKG